MELLSPRGGFTLDDLIALNDEIAALVRAGVPLERGLVDVGHDLPGRLGRVTTLLAERLSRGEQLDAALQALGDEVPPLYQAIVAAGLKSGRLAAALEGLAVTARRVAELRHVAATALIYPVIILLLGWALFVGFVTFFIPQVLPGFRDFHVTSANWLARFAELGTSVAWWAPIGPLIVLPIVAAWLWRSRRALSLGAGHGFAWVPGARRLVRSCRLATFADVLALLVDQGVPLGEGLRLSAAASGDRALKAEADRLAAAIERGAGPAEYLERAAHFPPLAAWFLSAGQEARLLGFSLRQAALSYHEHARQRAETVQTFLPVYLTLAIGGTTALVYALLLFVPWINLLKTLSTP
ncbi:MAG TPA: type II secretion system F family protein [Pirellulales bacterium]|nr:type II secretion system F family protein [Pirellulales bacterium]